MILVAVATIFLAFGISIGIYVGMYIERSNQEIRKKKEREKLIKGEQFKLHSRNDREW